MRSFQQRMEEIQRRSEIIRQRRKKQFYIAITMIPTALCVSMLLVFILPGMIPENAAELTLESNAATEEVPFVSNGNSYVQISGGDISYTVYDSESVVQIIYLLNGISAPEMNQKETDEIQELMKDSYKEIITDNCVGSDIASNSSVLEYSVILHMNNGDTIEYHLVGNQLKSTAFSGIRILNETELNKLMDLLGIS